MPETKQSIQANNFHFLKRQNARAPIPDSLVSTGFMHTMRSYSKNKIAKQKQAVAGSAIVINTGLFR